MGLKHHPDASRELAEAIAWYEADYPGRGRRFADAFVAVERLVLATPHGFPAWRQGSDVRVAVLQRFPYSLFFRAQGRVIVLYAVAHHKRRPGYWRKRLTSG